MNKVKQQTIEDCLAAIEKKLNWGDSSHWHNDVFIELSELIHSKTKVLLSPTTLKRVWGKVSYNSSPSISTLNTLAQFLGFENWRDFQVNSNPKSPSFFQKKVVPYLSIIVPSAALLTLVFISFFSMTNLSGNQKANDFSLVQFSSQPVTAGLPNSVVFDFNLKGIHSDSIRIQQFWDPTKTITLQQNQEQATGIYYFPGYFKSKLIVDNEIIREHDLFIKSQGWAGTLDYNPIPKYFVEEALLKQGKLSFPKTALQEMESSDTPLVSTFHMVDEFRGTSGDHIEVQAKVKNTYNEKWAVCETLRIVILGKEGALIIPFSQLGCVSDLGLMLNNSYISGKEKDLSVFGIGLSEDRTIFIRILNKQVTVLVDNAEIYSGVYGESIGEFVGMRFRFLGLGEVNQLSVQDKIQNKLVLVQGE